MVYRVLADATMTAHFLFLVYVALGGFLAWRWPKAWLPHAAVAAYGLVIAVFDFVCPLTPVEHRFRQQAGQAGLEPTGFIDTYIEGVIYPAEYILPARVFAVTLIFASWAGALALYMRRRPTGMPRAQRLMRSGLPSLPGRRG